MFPPTLMHLKRMQAFPVNLSVNVKRRIFGCKISIHLANHPYGFFFNANVISKIKIEYVFLMILQKYNHA